MGVGKLQDPSISVGNLQVVVFVGNLTCCIFLIGKLPPSRSNHLLPTAVGLNHLPPAAVGLPLHVLAAAGLTHLPAAAGGPHIHDLVAVSPTFM